MNKPTTTIPTQPSDTTAPGSAATARPTYRAKASLPGLVLGTAGLGGVWGAIDTPESIDTILYALENGVARLDTAPAYRDAESIVGQALKQWSGQPPFVSTKVGKLRADRADERTNNYDPKVMERSVKQSQDTLGVDRIDLLFLHEPDQVPTERVAEVIDFLVRVRQSGWAAAIGLGGNVPATFYPAIQQGHFDVVMSFNNLDACCLDGMQEAIPFFRKHSLTTYQGSALHMGLLGNRYEKYQQQAPEWISEADLRRARHAAALAQQLAMKLSTLAHRYLLSMEEVDYLVLGAKNQQQLTQTLSDCQAGKLDEAVFNELTNQIR
ncbi:aldo/keto reductase [Tunicatimonas pelagia]|uniref:aldo/keto reductase n=1 Tax=Tunicatimonas pelagia TaxID=931531 RepID=UPI002665CC55|nr:aldo/keto reductase [Tunicatimonas pelagia]WKN45475.1 aldo/keto reductase [Tunicatimonas pelagia]